MKKLHLANLFSVERQTKCKDNFFHVQYKIKLLFSKIKQNKSYFIIYTIFYFY